MARGSVKNVRVGDTGGVRQRPEMVYGSRPPSMRAPTPPSIKPKASSTTAYGKPSIGAFPGGFGNTGLTGES